jgi:hypothetical protein
MVCSLLCISIFVPLVTSLLNGICGSTSSFVNTCLFNATSFMGSCQMLPQQCMGMFTGLISSLQGMAV